MKILLLMAFLSGGEPVQKVPVYIDTLKSEAIDPVCGMKIARGSTRTARFGGKIYGFCCNACREAFLRKPDKYLSRKK